MKIYTESELKAMPVKEVMEKIGSQSGDLAHSHFGESLKRQAINRYLTSLPKVEPGKNDKIATTHIDKPSPGNSHK